MNYITDPNLQLYLMQQTGYTGFPGLPGFSMGGPGANMLSATAGAYTPAIAGAGMVDISPLAPFGLNNMGLPGQLLGVAGNIYLSNRLEQAGLMSLGNAASVQQAIDARQMQTVQRNVMSGVAGQDASNIYQFFRGAAAIAGVPMDSNQRFAARQMASNIAQYSPVISMTVPGGSEFLDMMSGRAGSVQSMASQMMEANRYRMDPLTGRYGFGSEANTQMISGVFNTMFSQDNIARMQGLRAGDVGQLYRTLSAEGLAGPTESLRDRTLNAILDARRSGTDVNALVAGTNVDANLLTGDVNQLSNQQLSQLRKNATVQERLTKSDAQQISGQLQEYVDAIAAMREVFGEAGNPNAPMPQLIGALKALTGGQMQRFDPASLSNMVRDMQAMSQMSGKSIDQILAMSQTANSMNTSILGSNAVNFNPATVAAGIAGGMAFSQVGAATGFGAFNRQQAEQATMSLFSRGLGSETSQAMGALLRVQQSGGFSNNAAGQQLKAIMSAAAAGQDTYTFNGATMAMPTTLSEFRALAANGGIAGGDATTFNLMLGDTTANLRALAENPEMQQVAFQQQRRQINDKLNQAMSFRIGNETALRTGITDNAQRAEASRSISRAGLDALNSLTPAELQRPELRIQAMAEAIKAEAATYNINLSDEQARSMAAGQFGQAEETIQTFGFDSYTQYAQVHGKQVSQARTASQQAAAVRSMTNSSLAKMQTAGGISGRLGAAIMRQADRSAAGEDVNMDTLLQDVFGNTFTGESQNLTGPLQAVQEIYKELREIEGQFEGATPEQQKQLRQRADELKGQLDTAVTEAGVAVEASGIGAAQNLAKLSLGDYEEDAKKLGITKEEYLEAIKTGKMPSSVKVISDKEVLKKAKNAENVISSTDREIAAYTKELQSTDPEVRRRAEASIATARAKRQLAVSDKNAGMAAMGLTPGNAADEKKYKEQLAAQGSAALLSQRASSWASSSEALAGKVGADKVDEKINEATELEKKARAEEAEAEAKVLATAELNTLADAFGLDTSEERKGLADKLKSKDEDSAASDVANQKMLAGVMKKMEKANKALGSDVSSIDRLDMLTDLYRNAKSDPDELKKLAASYKMSVKDLETVMRQTEFLGMAEDRGVYTEDKLSSALGNVSGRDIAAEVTEEGSKEMTVNGTLNITGNVVNGSGTLQNTTGGLGN